MTVRIGNAANAVIVGACPNRVIRHDRFQVAVAGDTEAVLEAAPMA